MLKLVLATLFLFQVLSSPLLPPINGITTSSFQTFLSLLGFNNTLPNAGPTTLFVPTDVAFANLDPFFTYTITTQAAWNFFAKDLIAYHIVPGSYKLADLRTGPLPTESTTRTLSVDASFYLPKVNGAQIVIGDIAGPFGPVHIVDSVLFPGDFGDLTYTTIMSHIYFNARTFTQLVTSTNLLPYLQNAAPKEVFIPTDDAFAALPRGLVAILTDPQNLNSLKYVLEYHIAPVTQGYPFFAKGQTVPLTALNGRILGTAGSSILAYYPTPTNYSVSYPLIISDIYAQNARLNFIGSVILPPEFPFTRIPTTLATIPSLSIFLQLVNKGGNLWSFLNSSSSATVFAPSDAAFQSLPAGILSSILEDITTLTAIFYSHVVPGSSLLTSDLAASLPSSLATSSTGFSIQVTQLKNGELLLNGNIKIVTITLPSGLISSDIISTNGVIHVIDTVIFPPNYTPTDSLTALSTGTIPYNFSIFLSVISQASNAPGMFYPPILRPSPILPPRLYPHTLFAPTNDAFNQLPKGYLADLQKPSNVSKLTALALYHFTRGANFAEDLVNQTFVSLENRDKFYLLITPNSFYYLNPFDEITFNNALIVDSDYATTTGIVHVINKVILPVWISPLDLYGTLLANGFTEFVNIANQNNFTNFLTQKGRALYTVFVPSDAIINATTTSLATVAQYWQNYVAKNATLSTELLPSQYLSTLGGTPVNVTKSGGAWYANGVSIIQFDIIAKNGIIHVINGLFPVPFQG